jgi:hypothetical protein
MALASAKLIKRKFSINFTGYIPATGTILKDLAWD